MADEPGFSFITVGAAEEEDVVIQAGIVEVEDEKPQAEPVRAEEVPSDTAQADAPKLDKRAKLEAAFGSKEQIPASEEALSKSKPAPAPKPVSRSAKEYEEATTLADLDANEPMPAVRFALIGAAIVALVAFLVYFNFFM